MIFALPTQTIQAFLAIHKLGWRPRIFINSVSIDPFVMEVVQGTRARGSSRARPRAPSSRTRPIQPSRAMPA